MKHSQTRIATLLTLALVFSFAPNALLRAEEVPPVDPPVVQEEIPQENAGVGGEALPPADSIVLSGDAESIGETTVDVNTSDIDTPPSVDTDVSIDNVIETVGTTTSSAETGANTAQNVDGNAGAFAGDAYAHATQIQVIDTNIINSEGFLFFADIFSGLGFDMRSLNLSFFTLENPSPTSCSFMGCPDGDLTVTANNTSDVIGDVSASAIAGGNTATSVGGNAAAVGGNAYASANGVQIVDSNIIESNYLLIGINQFGDLLDDITLPNESFFRSLLTKAPAISGPLSVSATTTIETSLTTDADADSGGNTAISDGAGAEAISGDAESAATAYSQVGSTLVGGDEIFFLFRIWGNWSGEIHGLPEGMTWEGTPFGIEIRNASGAPATNTDLDEEGCCGDQGELTVNTTNDSHAELSVRAYALTGDNRAETVEGTALAASGDAFAAANSVQIVSTNLIGRNWILAIFNIFGDWDGNVAFGHPDLWVGAIAEAGNPALPDSDITYRFTVTNNGDAKATNVRLKTNFSTSMLDFYDADENGEGAIFSLGALSPGESEEFTYVARTGAVPSGSSVAVPLSATALSRETDNNMSDNTEELTVVITNPSVSGGGNRFHRKSNSGVSKLTLTKTANKAEASLPGSVDYTVSVKNGPTRYYNTVLKDVLKDPNGTVMEEQSFSLGAIQPNEEITITYTATFAADAVSGVYTNTVTLEGEKKYDGDWNPLTPLTASYDLQVGVAATCPQYLSTYMRPGADNNLEEVKKLQAFLIESEGETEVTESGSYDEATIAAVHRFQEKNSETILSPWGATESTGFVYYTTQKLINELYCNGEREFPLSNEQESDIRRTREIIVDWRKQQEEEVELDLPEGVEVGVSDDETPQVAVLTVPPQEERRGWFSSLIAGAGVPFLHFFDR